MSARKPTPAQLKLLQAVAAGEVWIDCYGQAAWDEGDLPHGRGCTHYVLRLRSAGWVKHPGWDSTMRPRWRKATLTPEGARLLADTRAGGAS